MFELIETESIGSLKQSFSACIFVPAYEDVLGRESEIFELVLKQIQPLLLPGAFVMVKTTPDTSFLTSKIFEAAGFSVEPAMIRLLEYDYEPWLIFQNRESGEHPRLDPECDYLRVIPFFEPTQDERAICNGAPDQPPQKMLRNFIRMLCPDPENSRVLVPYFVPGWTVAACEAVGVESVGFDTWNHCLEEDFADIREIIDVLATLETAD